MVGGPVFHQIVNTIRFRHKEGEIIPASQLSNLGEQDGKRHLPAKPRNNRRRTESGEWEVINRGPAARVPREGMMVSRRPMD